MSLRWFLFALAPLLSAAEQNGAKEFFETRVRPLLAKNCFSCHTTSRMGGLEMKSREALLVGGKSGPAVVPGDPDHSLLIQAVRQTHAKLKMPPQGKLSDSEISDLAAWVKSGAVCPAKTLVIVECGIYVSAIGELEPTVARVNLRRYS